MQKAKHSKFRNTGLLFELLTRQITADILSGKNNSPAKNLMFKYFAENKELGKEWILYKFLIDEHVGNDVKADKYISITLSQRTKLNNKKLKEEKFNLIKELKQEYSIENLLKSNIKNYKILASIYKLFENHVESEIKFDIKEIVQARQCITENLLGNNINKTQKQEDVDLKYYREQNEDIRLLSYKIMIETLNDKYKDFDENQKMLLREYINNITNTNKLNIFIDEQVNKVSSELKECLSKIDSDVIKIKLSETVKQIEKVKDTKAVKDNHVTVLLLAYELLKEVKSKI